MGKRPSLNKIWLGVLCGSLLVLAGACKEDLVAPLAAKKKVVKQQKRISYTIKNYCASNGNTLSDLFLINASYVIANNEFQIDTDRDGIPDYLDVDPRMGLSPFSSFTSVNGFGDLIVFATGMSMDSANNLMAYGSCTNPNLDSDGDGLSDCAETMVLKTKSDSFDSDGDGIPDDLELRFGLNPLDPSDASMNTSGDGYTNAQKIRMQIPIRETLSDEMKIYNHQYELKPTSQNAAGQFCFDMKVSQIPIVAVSNGNLIVSYVLEKTSGSSSAMSTRLNRCCSVVPNSTADGASISVLWGQSSELICPCPLAMDVR